MGIIQKQAIRGTAYSYAGVAIGFVTVLVLPKILEQSEIGITRILHAQALLFAVIFGFGMPAMTIRLFPYFRDPEKQHKGFLFISIMMVLAGFALSQVGLYFTAPLLMESGQETSGELEKYLFLLSPLIFFFLLFNAIDAYMISLFKAVTGLLYRELIQRIGILTAILILFVAQIDFDLFLYMYVGALCLPGFMMVLYSLGIGQFSLKPSREILTKNMVKEMVIVSGYGWLTNAGGMFLRNIDALMINFFLGLSSTGIYSICFYFGALVSIPARSLALVSSSVLAESWKANDLDNIREIYHKSSLSQLIVGLFLFCCLALNLDNAFELIPRVYESGKLVILFIGLAQLSEMVTGVSGQIIGTSAHYKYNFYLLLLLTFLIVITNYFFIQANGITGAAFASFLSVFLYNLLKVIVIYKKFKLQPYSWKFALVTGFATVAFTIAYLIPVMSHFIADIIVRSLTFTVLFGVPILTFRLSEDINKAVSKVVNIALRRN